VLEDLLFVGREAGVDRLGEPAIAPRSIFGQGGAALIRQLEQRAPAVGWIPAAADQALRLELGERLPHRLWPDPFGGGQVDGALGAFSLEAPEHGPVGEGEAVLNPEAADELTEHDPELTRQGTDLGGGGHGMTIATGKAN